MSEASNRGKPRADLKEREPEGGGVHRRGEEADRGTSWTSVVFG